MNNFKVELSNNLHCISSWQYLFKITQKIREESGNCCQEMKRSPDKRHTQTHGILIETFQ